ncbi:hypothetical protein [Caldimonas sp. KR1-144]|uniref:hypothetical protein n=1 Tax=Caldimonas sp. KR1-144 TaxID=3400911 RepID=UPI003BFAE40E
MKMTCTHKGWFGICPVHIGDLYGQAPLVVERHWVFVPLLVLSEALFEVMLQLTALANPELELEWPLMITGELAVPRAIEIDEQPTE